MLRGGRSSRLGVRRAAFATAAPALAGLIACASASDPDSPSVPEAPSPMYAYPELAPPTSPLEEIFADGLDCAETSPSAVDAHGVVSIPMGSTVCLSFELDSGYFVPQVARELAAGVVVLQLSSSGSGQDARLVVFNPFGGLLKYRAGMRVPGDDDYYETSSCAVAGGGFASELWWHPVDEIVAVDFHVLPEGGSIPCS